MKIEQSHLHCCKVGCSGGNVENHGCVADLPVNTKIATTLIDRVKVFQYSFSEVIPIFFNRLKSVFFLVRSLKNFHQELAMD